MRQINLTATSPDNIGTPLPGKLALFFDDNNIPSYKDENNNVYPIVNVDNVKRYKARITQTGTNAPVATILENTLEETPTWVREDKGLYSINVVNNLFTYGKTVVTYSENGGNISIISLSIDSENTIFIYCNHVSTTPYLSDENKFVILIEVYP